MQLHDPIIARCRCGVTDGYSVPDVTYNRRDATETDGDPAENSSPSGLNRHGPRKMNGQLAPESDLGAPVSDLDALKRRLI